MTDEQDQGIRGPRVGRVAGLAGSGAGETGGDLPYAEDKRGLAAWLGVGLAALVLVVGVGYLLTQGGGSNRARTAGAAKEPNSVAQGAASNSTDSTDSTDSTGSTGSSVVSSDRSTTTAPATTAPATTPTTSPAATTVAPTTTPPTTVAPSTAPPTTTAPVPPHPTAPHRAVYRDGKLFLEGAVPNQEVAKAFFDKAASVIGPQNVINNYVIDPAAPTPTDGRVTVEQRFLFPTGSAVLDPSYSNVLELGVTVMKLYPQVVMVISGYTDNTGDPNDNLLLSQARASAVVNYLSARGIDVGRFRPIGKGDVDPVAPNDTDANRALNRRIEVTLLNLLAQ